MYRHESNLDNQESKKFHEVLDRLNLQQREDGKYYDWILSFKSHTKNKLKPSQNHTQNINPVINYK